MTIARLLPYPSTQARRQLPASQLASLNAVVASTLAQIVALPPTKRDIKSSQIYLQSYARDVSFQVLQSLIWDSQNDRPRISKDEELISRYSLQLAENVAPSLDLQTLLDLTIGYSTTKGCKSRLKAVLAAASEAGMPIHDAITKDLVSALALLLSPPSSSNQAQGLYAIRKTAHCILSFLRASPPSFIRHFAHSKDLVLSLGYAYNTSLTSIATSYGGISVLRNAIDRPPNVEVDDWERIWLDTKIALIDTFHIVIRQLLEDMSSAKGRSLGVEAERTFDIIFALLEQSTSSSSETNIVPPTPFLNRPLLADYQQSYSLSHTLALALKSAEEKDTRLDVIESTLAAFDSENADGKDPGVLKVVLRSYGMQQGIDNLGTRSKQRKAGPGAAVTTSSSNAPPPTVDAYNSNKGKGKAKATEPVEDSELDIKVTQVLDVLPDSSPDYVRLLLGNEMYKGDPEQVLSALLEGRAPTEEELNNDLQQHEQAPVVPKGYDFSQRQNVFDDQEMNLTQITTGKKNVEDNFKDRSFIDQMKADILRRAEAIFEEDEEDEENVPTASGTSTSKGIIFRAEDELEEAEAPKIKVMGDGEETDQSDAGTEDEAEEEKTTPETILELAWMRDPKSFDRDAATRRGKGREQLRKDTGWADEQIEGWKVMLDRAPKAQEKIKEKHQFRGNQSIIPPAAGPSHGGQDRGRGRGRGGRGRGGGGRGGGRGGRGGSTQGPNGDPNTARERSFKDKHKASRANHNRKRGHDKKMARSGVGVPPSS